jgi:hypothetical protein
MLKRNALKTRNSQRLLMTNTTVFLSPVNRGEAEAWLFAHGL